ncbi:hypothetical protein BDD12DRAFT_807461 [Trichophaea hybrida]|nr:hypothetical protein BDD12DRAFT_807461 [Trichophaea hybrida]
MGASEVDGGKRGRSGQARLVVAGEAGGGRRGQWWRQATGLMPEPTSIEDYESHRAKSLVNNLCTGYTSPYMFAYEQSDAVYVRGGDMGQLEDCIHFSLDTCISIISHDGFPSRAAQQKRNGNLPGALECVLGCDGSELFSRGGVSVAPNRQISTIPHGFTPARVEREVEG